MSRKDYRGIAEILATTTMPADIREELVARFVTLLADDNPRFRPSMFREACEPVGHPRMSSDYSRLFDLGYRDGTAAGSWVTDGNTSEDVAREMLRMIEDGDPALDYPAPLSGEWADGRTPSGLLAEVDASEDDPNADGLLSQYEAGYAQGWEAEVVRSCRTIAGLLPADLRR